MKQYPSSKVKPRRYSTTEVEALFSSIGEGLIATDEAGIVTRINQSALDIFGYKLSEILYKRFTKKIVAIYETGKPLNIVDTPIAKSFMTGQIISQRIIYRRKDSSAISVHVTVSPLIIDNKPVGSVQLFRDITDELKMDKMKSDFISLASHQLRTPLSSVNIYANMLMDGLGGELNELQSNFTRTILSSVQRMNELIDTLLNITRIETKGIEISPSPVNIRNLIDEVISGYSGEITDKNLHLQTTADGQLCIKTDRQLLKEIMVNLLTNSVKYTPSEGAIEINVQKNNNNIVMSFKDTGYGIPINSQPSIFTKFFRADNILTHDVSGTGIGLYLTKMITESLDGDLWFESVENKGTVFYLTLPLDLSNSR
jgi:PAS domain S-box-containing protein